MNKDLNEHFVEEERRKLEVESHFENDLAKPNRTDPLANEFENNELDQEIHKELDTPMGQHPLSDEYESNELNSPPVSPGTDHTRPSGIDPLSASTINKEPKNMDANNTVHNPDAEPNGMDPQNKLDHGLSFQKTPGEIHADNMDPDGKQPNSINPAEKRK